VLFIISPLNNFFKTSLFMKIIALIILTYTLYLNTQQTNLLKSASLSVKSEKVMSQLNMNIICSYVFTLFIGLLIIFVIKSFF
jgi:capsular polysaccharide biosynthesis protein